MFLRNHDELTLEPSPTPSASTCSQEYAAEANMQLNLGIRRRLWPLMQGGRRQIELLHALVLCLPGCTVLYYGDELGMGDDLTLGDRMGVRTPMQWTTGKSAGFSTAEPDRLCGAGHHRAGVSLRRPQRGVARAQADLVPQLAATRAATHRADPAFRGRTVRVLPVENRRVFAAVREHDGRAILCVNNLSRFAQAA